MTALVPILSLHAVQRLSERFAWAGSEGEAAAYLAAQPAVQAALSLRCDGVINLPSLDMRLAVAACGTVKTVMWCSSHAAHRRARNSLKAAKARDGAPIRAGSRYRRSRRPETEERDDG